MFQLKKCKLLAWNGYKLFFSANRCCILTLVNNYLELVDSQLVKAQLITIFVLRFNEYLPSILIRHSLFMHRGTIKWKKRLKIDKLAAVRLIIPLLASS